MKQYKKIFALLLAACMLLSLAACAKNNETPSENPTEIETAPPVPSYELPATDDPAQTEPAATGTEDIESVPGTVTEKMLYAADDLKAGDPRLDEIVARCGDYEISDRVFQMFFWMQYINFINTYGDYLSLVGLDASQPLDGQLCYMTETPMTWEQFFVTTALDQFNEYAAVSTKAAKEGFALSDEEKANLLTAIENLQTYASSNGFSSMNDLLQSSFGPGVNKADYEWYLTTYNTMLGYETKLQDEVEFTDADIDNYYTENADNYAGIGTDHNDISVRHILIKTKDADGDGESTDEEIAAAKTRAEELLAEYEKDPTEENFAKLAEEFSEDDGSAANGGLYENVFPGQMVEAFNDWCFENGRKTGDTGIVQTNFGFHVMYFVEQLETYYWRELVKSDYAAEQIGAVVRDIRAEYPVETDYAKIFIGNPIDPTEAAG